MMPPTPFEEGEEFGRDLLEKRRRLPNWLALPSSQQPVYQKRDWLDFRRGVLSVFLLDEDNDEYV